LNLGDTLKVLFFANSGWFLDHFCLPLLRAVRAQGHEVVVVSPPGQYALKLEQAGFRWCALPVERSGINPFRECMTVLRLVRVYRRERPDLAHNFTLKCALYGSLAAHFAGIRAVVNAITGVGYIFASTDFRAKLLRPFVTLLCRIGFRNTQAIFENPENKTMFIGHGIVSEDNSHLIRGAGVDTRRFGPSPEASGVPTVLMAGRMLWDKGVAEFVEAARRVKREGAMARFVLVGGCDPENPGAVPRESLHQWTRAGMAEWWDAREDMPMVLSQAHVVCLPSYGEGVPTVLIEAAASGRAIVATDVPGCREVVRHGENGLLVPPRNPEALAEAIATLLKDPALRARMGARGREIAVQEFSEERMVRETLEVYRELLGPKWPGDSCR
jgi:glycosyltransferase involved in cell wall biosynthesis